VGVTYDFGALGGRFAKRRTKLRAPFAGDAAQVVSERLGVSLAPSTAMFFNHFDGFPAYTYDATTQYRIWTLEEIVAETEQQHKILPRTSFADFLIESSRLSFDLSQEISPIICEGEGVIASSFLDFVTRLSLGEYDWL